MDKTKAGLIIANIVTLLTAIGFSINYTESQGLVISLGEKLEDQKEWSGTLSEMWDECDARARGIE